MLKFKLFLTIFGIGLVLGVASAVVVGVSGVGRANALQIISLPSGFWTLLAIVGSYYIGKKQPHHLHIAAAATFLATLAFVQNITAMALKHSVTGDVLLGWVLYVPLASVAAGIAGRWLAGRATIVQKGSAAALVLGCAICDIGLSYAVWGYISLQVVMIVGIYCLGSAWWLDNILRRTKRKVYGIAFGLLVAVIATIGLLWLVIR